jgi:hypothetical protein
MYSGEGILRLAHSPKGSGSNDSHPPRGSRGQMPSETLKLSSFPQRGVDQWAAAPHSFECEEVKRVKSRETNWPSTGLIHMMSAGTLTTRETCYPGVGACYPTLSVFHQREWIK